MNKVLILTILLLFILSCNKENEQKVVAPKKYFSVNFRKLKPDDSSWAKYLTWDNIEERNLGEDKIYYTINKKFHVFENTLLEIQFPSVRYKLDSKYRSLHCLICSGYLYDDKLFYSDDDKCFYFLWLNRTLEDKFGRFEFKWEIGKSTDTIYSNLDKKVIAKIFPKFKGIVIDGKITEIKIYRNYDVSEWLFYQDIEFVGFDRYEDIYKIYKDSLTKSKQKFKNEH